MNTNEKNYRDEQSFQMRANGMFFHEHDKYMKEFRMAHDKTSNSVKEGNPPGWLFLPAIQKVPMTRYCPN